MCIALEEPKRIETLSDSHKLLNGAFHPRNPARGANLDSHEGSLRLLEDVDGDQCTGSYPGVILTTTVSSS